MKRSNTLRVLSHDNLVGFKQKVVYHEAGHATGIHFGSIQKNLPPIFFQIIFNQVDGNSANNLLNNQFDSHAGIARVKGGRLIETLPLLTFKELDTQLPSDTNKKAFRYSADYRLAFETDIINLLISPLAEAKYTAIMDNEQFHHELFTVQALKNYGGDADLAVINDYLQSYSVDQYEQKDILNQLFIKAFNFVNDHANWKAITSLANYILNNDKNFIDCEEVAAVLDGK